MSTEYRKHWRDRRREKWDRYDRDMERCGRCGQARINVVHTVDRENAPEGLDYYADVPFCEFLPTGELVGGAANVHRYVPADRR